MKQQTPALVIQVLADLRAWALSDAVILPAKLLDDVRTLDSLENIADEQEPEALLVLAIGMLGEDAARYRDNLVDSRQPDGSPCPRFWAAARSVAMRAADLKFPIDEAALVLAFALREAGPKSTRPRKQHRDAGWKARRALKNRVMAEIETGDSAREITDRLRRDGIEVSITQVAAYLGHARLRKGSHGTATGRTHRSQRLRER